MTEPVDIDIQMDPVSELVCKSCGQRFNTSALTSFTSCRCPHCRVEQVVPARLGAFLLLGLVGRGGMGAVYRGHDVSLDREVAIKVMLRSLGDNREFVETFRREAKAAAALNHPNVVHIYAFGVEKGQPYIVMELLAGGRLDQMMAKGEPLDEYHVIRTAIDVAEGLGAASAIGLVHGDVKPENVLYDVNGVAKVVDFGLAQFAGRQGPTTDGGVWGTPYYIAPERVRRQPADARSDIYSLGATLYHALAGRPPFEGQTPIDVVKARLEKPAPPLEEVRPNIHPNVARIIARMLEAEPSKRYPTYASLLADLRDVLATLQPGEITLSPPKRQSGKIVINRSRLQGIGGAFGAAAEEPEILTDTQRRKKRMVLAISLGVVGLLALAGLGTGLWLSHRADAQAAAAREEEARQKRAQTVAQAVAAAERIVALDSNGMARMTQALEQLATVSNAVAGIRLMAGALGEQANAPATLAEATGVRVQAEAAGIWVRENATYLSRLTAEARTLEQEARAAAATNEARQAQQRLDAFAVLAGELDVGLHTASTNLETLAGLADLMQKRLSAEKDAFDTEQAQRAQQKADEEKRAAEEAEAARLKAELEAKARTERERVAAVAAANVASVQRLQIAAAQQALEAELSGLETEEGRQAREAVRERYRALASLKPTLIGMINANPWHWGWEGRSDVKSADDTAIVISSRTVPWTEVTVAQLIRFLRHYVPLSEAPRREKAQFYFATACFLYETGRGNDRAMEMAADHAAEAVRLDSALKPTVAATMPDLPDTTP